jgi:hypothetical protein
MFFQEIPKYQGDVMYKNGYYIAQFIFLSILILLSMSAAGCDVIGGIFKAGMWTAVIIIVLLVGAVMLVMRLVKGGK